MELWKAQGGVVAIGLTFLLIACATSISSVALKILYILAYLAATIIYSYWAIYTNQKEIKNKLKQQEIDDACQYGM